MIPSRLGLYWEGGPMSWLRLQTIQTFARHHPDWQIELVSSPERLRGRIPPDARADLARWEWLRFGGFFADTDIIFIRPIPRAWREGELAVTMDGGTVGPDGLAFAIGLTGARPGSHFFAELYSRCLREIAGAAEDHQAVGTRALARHWSTILKPENTVGIPAASLYPYGFRSAGLARSWDPTDELPSGLVGLHWSGGFRFSREHEPKVDPRWAAENTCPVAQALREAYR